jgi:hypothetical protein
MGIRESLNRSPKATAIAGVVLLLAAGLVGWATMRPEASSPTPQTFYTADDGATYFPSAERQIPPFPHNGGEAVQAFVYRCGDGEPFVGVMKKYGPGVRERLLAAEDPTDVLETLKPGDILLKRPGGPWLASGSPQAASLFRVACPDGSPAQAQQPGS